MRKKKIKRGFTLIELIAVIAVLAIIALIAIVKTVDSVNDARKMAFKSTTQLLIDAARLLHADEVTKFTQTTRTVSFVDGVSTGYNLKFNGAVPQDGTILIKDNGKIAVTIYDGKYCSVKNLYEEDFAVTNENETDCLAKYDTTLYVKPDIIIEQPGTITVLTNVTFDVSTSPNDEGYTVINTQWNNVLTNYPEGDNTVSVRVQYSNGMWSDWSDITFHVEDIFSPSTISTARSLFTDSSGFIRQQVDSNGNINYYRFNVGTITRRVLDQDGVEISPTKTLVTGAWQNSLNNTLNSFDAVIDENDNSYIVYLMKSGQNSYTHVAKFNSSGNLVLDVVAHSDSNLYDYNYEVSIDKHDDRLFVVFQDTTVQMVQLDLSLSIVVQPILLGGLPSPSEIDIKISDNRIYALYNTPSYYASYYYGRLAILNRDGSHIRTINLNVNEQYRWVGELEFDQLGVLWVMSSFSPTGDTFEWKAYTLASDELSLTSKFSIVNSGVNVNAELLSNGEILLLYGSPAVYSRYLKK